MAVERWNRRAIFTTSVGIRQSGGSVVNANITGFINNAGTLGLTQSGTSFAGTAALLDLTRHRLRVPTYGTALGTATGAFGPLLGGSEGQIRVGYTAASAQLGLVIGGTVFVLNFATAGGAVSAIASPAGA
jgi:hypothetical protein